MTKKVFNKKEYNREYREKNRERLKLYARAFRKKFGSTRDFVKQKATLDAWKKKYPERRKAQGKLAYAIKTGKIKKGRCEVCGIKKVHAHHKDYDKPLDVIWLCPIHHHEQDNKENKRKARKVRA